MKAWTRLECNGCGVSTVFIALVHLKWQEGGGMVQEPAGYCCQQCGGVVDGQVLIARAKLKAKKAEIAEMEQEAASLGAQTAAKAKTAATA